MMNSGIGYIVFTLTVLSIIFLVNGCSEEKATISRSNQIQADSIIRERSKLMVTEIDSLCELAYQRNFDRAVDSVSKIRLKEIENYIPAR